MARRKAEALSLKPWDRRPWPPFGNVNLAEVYSAVGQAITAWELHEAALSAVFCAFVVGEDDNILPAFRAYSAVRTFEGRAEMLRACSEAFFWGRPDREMQDALKEIVRNSVSFAPRRNEIAHGVVSTFFTDPRQPNPRRVKGTFALLPNSVTYKEIKLEDGPTYCYTARELMYYKTQFLQCGKNATEFSSNFRLPPMMSLPDTPP